MDFDPLPVSVDKEQYYDEAALRKRANRRSRHMPETTNTLAAPLRPNHRYGNEDELGDDMVDMDEYERKQAEYKHVDRYRPDEWYPESELFAAELWKAQTLDIIDNRLISYEPGNAECGPPIHSGHTTSIHTSAAQRVLRVTELLDHILLIGGPETQLRAWNVSKKWRAIADRIIRHNCPRSGSEMVAVAFGDTITSSSGQLDVSSEELHEFELQLAHAQAQLDDLDSPDEVVFFPAKLTQAFNMSEELSAKVENFEMHQHYAIAYGGNNRMRIVRDAGLPYEVWGFDESEVEGHKPKWLDFSQFVVNPYFTSLFGSSLTNPLGRYDIVLPAHHNVIDGNAFPEELVDSIGHIFITEPPCKTIGLYNWKPNWQADGHASLQFVAEVHQNDGVRLRDLLISLRTHSSESISSWIKQVRQLRRWVQSGHWKQDVWIVPGAPKLVMLFSNQSVLRTAPMIGPVFDFRVPYTDLGQDKQWIQSINREPRTVRQAEWMPREMFKPSRCANTFADVLPGIYSIGLGGNPFEESDENGHWRRERFARLLERIRRRVEMLDWQMECDLGARFEEDQLR